MPASCRVISSSFFLFFLGQYGCACACVRADVCLALSFFAVSLVVRADKAHSVAPANLVKQAVWQIRVYLHLPGANSSSSLSARCARFSVPQQSVQATVHRVLCVLSATMLHKIRKVEATRFFASLRQLRGS